MPQAAKPATIKQAAAAAKNFLHFIVIAPYLLLLIIDVIYLKSPAAGRAIGGSSAKTESPCFSRLLRKIQGR